VTPAKITTGADGTITIPAAAFAPAPLTDADVNITKSYLTDGTQLMHNGGAERVFGRKFTLEDAIGFHACLL
jgi:hypothetical protein